MKRMRVSEVYYYVKGSTDDKRCADRLARMLPFIDADAVKEATLEELDALLGRLGPDLGRPRHPYVFFGQFKQWTPAEEQELARKYPHLQQGWGFSRIRGTELVYTAGGFNNVSDGYICRPLWSLDPTLGCFHACTYCIFCDMTALGMTLNVEELIDHVREAMRLVPWQKNWHNGGATDIFCFEPEYGYTEQVLDIAAEQDRNVLFFTSTDNVDFLGGLKNRGRAIIEWTISPHGLVKWERKAPGLAARLEAMQKCKEFGCTVRCQFAPFVPLADWRDEYHQMIQELLAVVEPDFIAMHMVRGCPHPVSATLRRWFGPNGIDPEYMAMVEDAEKGGGVATFPAGHVLPAHGREKMYRFVIDEIRAHSRDIPLVLCRETPDMWKHFQADLRTDPANCGCGTLPRG